MERERITGEKRFQVFEALRNDKTFLKMNLTGMDFERLTIVLEIDLGEEGPLFLIDAPAGLREALRDEAPGKIRFEFTGPDNLQYLFNTSGGQVLHDRIWIRLPESIERIQRRRHFRLEAPLGTRLYVSLDGRRQEMNVINVSQGGLLVAPLKGTSRSEIIRTGDYLRRIALVFPSEEDHPSLTIEEALVRRREQDTLTGEPRYGLQFTRLEKKTEKVLTDIIYRLQRQFLRKRGFIEP